MADVPKLSPRQWFCLHIIAECTDRDWSTGEIHRYFVPMAPTRASSACMVSGPGSAISGSSDAASLRALARRGLIERPRGCEHPNPYCFALTEDGHMAIERAKERNP